MLSINRMNGNGALFLTVAPITWKYGFFWRINLPVTSNYDYETIKFNGGINNTRIPVKNGIRRAIKYASPNADCLTYLSLLKGLAGLLGIENTDMFLSESKKSSTPRFDVKDRYNTTQKRRGVLGHVSVAFVANEASTDGIPHAHWKLYNGMNSRFFEKLAENVTFNKQVGEFLDSLIMNELSYKRTYDDIKPFQNPTNV